MGAFALYANITSLANGGTGSENFYRANRSNCTLTHCDSTFSAQTAGAVGTLGTNIFVNPAFTNTTDLLANQIGAPNCAGFTNTTACMGWDAPTSTLTAPSVISDLVPTASGTAGKGYQKPSTTCAANADFPAWLKGIVHLQGERLRIGGDLYRKSWPRNQAVRDLGMATTGTFDFAPSVGECVLNALSRIQIRGPMVKAEMLHMATLEANLLQSEWSNRGPNLWTVDEQEVDTVPGYATYPVDPSTIAVLEVTLGQGDPPTESEILLTSISRTTYMSYPNKASPGRPTVYWYDMLIAPTITLWPVPEQVYRLHFTRYRQQQDASMRAAGNPETPYRWLDALCAGLAARLATHYAPALEATRTAQAERAYGYAAARDKENAPIYLSPMIEFYSA